MSERNRSLIVFEGLPGSGKTSVLKAVESQLFGRIAIIPELLTPIDPLTGNDFYAVLANDENKYSRFLSGTTHAVMDRGYPSTLNWDYVLLQEGEPNHYDEKMCWYLREIGKKLIFPTAYFYFNVPIETSMARKRLPDRRNLSWSRPDSLTIAVNYYLRFFSTVEPQVPVEFIDANAASEKVISQVVDKIKRYLDA